MKVLESSIEGEEGEEEGEGNQEEEGERGRLLVGVVASLG